MTFRNVAIAAAAVACLSSAAYAQKREPVTARVSYAGLDLTKVADRRILDARIDRAARFACRSNGFGIRQTADEGRCREEMRRDGQVRLAQLVPVAVASTK